MFKLIVITFVFGVALTAPAIDNNVSDTPLEETVTVHELIGGDLDSFFEIHDVPSTVDAHSSVQDLNITVETPPEENTADRSRRSVTGENDKVEEDTACIKKGQKGTCVPYYLCSDDSKHSSDSTDATDSAADIECPSYIETCCHKKLMDIATLIDIQ